MAQGQLICDHAITSIADNGTVNLGVLNLYAEARDP